jgi:hypothetical protein
MVKFSIDLWVEVCPGGWSLTKEATSNGLRPLLILGCLPPHHAKTARVGAPGLGDLGWKWVNIGGRGRGAAESVCKGLQCVLSPTPIKACSLKCTPIWDGLG